MKYIFLVPFLFVLLFARGQTEEPSTGENLKVVKALGADSLNYIDPEMLQVYNKGVELLKNGNAGQSISYFDQAISMNPNYSKAYFNRAIAKKESNDPDGAVKDLMKFVELDSIPEKGYYQAALVYYDTQRHEEALAMLDLALKADPATAKYNYRKGVIFYLLGDYDSAIDEFSAALRLKPDNA